MLSWYFCISYCLSYQFYGRNHYTYWFSMYVDWKTWLSLTSTILSRIKRQKNIYRQLISTDEVISGYGCQFGSAQSLITVRVDATAGFQTSFGKGHFFTHRKYFQWYESFSIVTLENQSQAFKFWIPWHHSLCV